MHSPTAARCGETGIYIKIDLLSPPPFHCLTSLTNQLSINCSGTLSIDNEKIAYLKLNEAENMSQALGHGMIGRNTAENDFCLPSPSSIASASASAAAAVSAIESQSGQQIGGEVLPFFRSKNPCGREHDRSHGTHTQCQDEKMRSG